jgi:beta-1,2-mannobiose phosphorylase / 1,2-beta-oligomannan phosphorylase
MPDAPQPRMLYGDATRHGRPFAKDPCVIRFGGRYLMYYSMTPATDTSLPRGWAIGIAESQDLVEWRKVGDILPVQECEKNGLVNGQILLLDGKLHLFYNSYGNYQIGSQANIRPTDALCHATSEDGIHFTRNPTNPIWYPKDGWNNGRAIDLDVIEWGGKLIIYYATRDPSGKVQMLHAVTADRNSDFGASAWSPLCEGPILKPELPWETNCIEAPSVLKREGKLYLFYGGGYNNDPQQIGCALSQDGVHFERLFLEPLIPNGEPGDWNASETGHPGVFEDSDGRTYLFVQGNNDRGHTWFLSCYEIGWRDGRPFVMWDSPKFPMKPVASAR